jgi:hypothetical protein
LRRAFAFVLTSAISSSSFSNVLCACNTKKPLETRIELMDSLRRMATNDVIIQSKSVTRHKVPPDHLLLDRSPNIGPLISRWELGKFKNCWNKSVRTSKILTFVSAIFKLVNFPTRCEWSKIRGTVQ